MWTTVLAIVKPSVRVRVRAHGHVQGVFFRDSVRRAADERDVRGWVRNRADGAVEAVFEGSQADVDALVEFVRAGPGASTVSSVDVETEDAEGLGGFEVR
jgi:acylphosphatase